MKKISELFIVATTTILLNACGGSTSSPIINSPKAAATFGDCFILSPGVKYSLTNGITNLVVKEDFEGQTAFGSGPLWEGNKSRRVNMFYQIIGNDYINFLGIRGYDSNTGVNNYKSVFSSSDRLPVNMTPGQTVQVSYTTTVYYPSLTTPATTTSNHVQVTFMSFETLNLGGHTFTDVCKVKNTDPTDAQILSEVDWVAKGYGIIQRESQNAQGVIEVGSHVELKNIITAP